MNFQITSIEPASSGATPLLNFHLTVSNKSFGEEIRAIMLQVQIHIQSARRSYTARERQKLAELFGASERRANTIRNRLWTVAHTKLGRFNETTKTILPVSCTFDLNVTATKYFYAIEEGAVPLQFNFSGTIFYVTSDGWLQAQQIPENKECIFPMPARLWRAALDQHFPNSAWLYLQRDVFDQLYAFKRSHGFATWEEAIGRLLDSESRKDSRGRKPLHAALARSPGAAEHHTVNKAESALAAIQGGNFL